MKDQSNVECSLCKTLWHSCKLSRFLCRYSFIHSNFSTVHLTCLLHPILKYAPKNPKVYIGRPNIINIYSFQKEKQIFYCPTSILYALKVKQTKNYKGLWELSMFEKNFCYSNANVHFISYETQMKWTHRGERVIFYIILLLFHYSIPNILQLHLPNYGFK